MKKLNANLVNIVNILKDHQYHDGTSIGKALRMTRSAVWKTIKKLQHYGVNIDGVKGKGYALQKELILLDQVKIQQQLLKKNVIVNVFETIKSTNDYLMASLRRGDILQEKISICLAEQQTQGKGRLNREWYSPFGSNVYMSCLFPFQKDISELAGLSLVVSLAMVKTLNSYSEKNHFSTKWPNDVVYDGKKVSGNLIEIHAESHSMCHAIIGMGLNVNMLEDNQQIAQAWTSLQRILNKYIDRNELCVRLISNLVDYLEEFAVHGFASFKDEWMRADCLTHKTITLRQVNKQIRGMVAGVNAQGYLLLKLDDGTLQVFSSGDTSVEKQAPSTLYVSG